LKRQRKAGLLSAGSAWEQLAEYRRRQTAKQGLRYEEAEVAVGEGAASETNEPRQGEIAYNWIDARRGGSLNTARSEDLPGVPDNWCLPHSP
jgi:hypothetical protein